MHMRKIAPLLFAIVSPLVLSSCFSFPISVNKEELVATNKYNYHDYTSNNTFNIDSCPSIGSPKLLIIPIWFTDSSNYIKDNEKKAVVREDIQKAYFGTTQETGWHSVSSFYKEESKDKCQLQGVVSEWYDISLSSSAFYTKKDNTVSLVKEATDWYFNNHSEESRTDYDLDGNGYLDGVMLIYGSPDYGALKDNSCTNMWAYCYWLQDTSLKNIANPGPNTFFWASYDFMYSSSLALLKTGTKYGSGDTLFCHIDAHTYIHEMGHVFGLEDYYDYSDQYSPAGGFSMQDYNVGGHDPYSIMALGWVDPIVPTVSCRFEIGLFQETHDLVLLSNNYTGSPFDEYLLLELYSPTGLNQFDSWHQYNKKSPYGPSSVGIRLWHIDSRLILLDNGRLASAYFSTNPKQKDYQVTLAFSNTYYDAGDSNSKKYISPLGETYSDYNIVQLIRNNKTDTYRPKTFLGESDLFTFSDSFSLKRFSKQFYRGNKMNNGEYLDWSFTITDFTNNKASISFNR